MRAIVTTLAVVLISCAARSDAISVACAQRHNLSVRKLFERLKVSTGIADVCAHMLRHTWATNFHRSRSGTRFDMQVEGGWTTGRMVERYCKGRPFEERRKAPSVFAASRATRSEKRPSEKRPSQKKSGLDEKRIA